jgi:hypothetical protein
VVRLVKIDGRFRRVLDTHGADARVVVGHSLQRATSKARPGPGWKPDIQSKDKRKWIRHVDQIEVRFVDPKEIVEDDDWPSGLAEHGFEPEDYTAIVSPVIELAKQQAGHSNRKAPPQIPLETFETAMPTEEELSAIVAALWGVVAKPKGRKAGGRTIIPPERVESKEVAAVEPESAPAFGDGVVPPVPEGLALPPAQLDERPEVIEPGHFWAENLRMVVPETDDNRMSDMSAGFGWPKEFIAGATRTKKGVAGFNLTFMSKNAYDPEVHAKVAIVGGGKAKG